VFVAVAGILLLGQSTTSKLRIYNKVELGIT